MKPTRNERSARSLGGVLQLQFALACTAFIYIGLRDGTIGVLLPSLQHQYALNKSTVSFLFFASTCGFLVASLMSGPLVERLGRRLFLTIGGVVLVGGLGVIATIPTWPIVLLAMCATGFGAAVMDAGMNAFVASLPDNTARLNYLHACFGGGALLGPLLASGILEISGRWNLVFAVMAAFAVLLVAGFGAIFRVSYAEAAPAPVAARIGSANSLVATLTLPIVWLAALFLLVYVGVEISVGGWAFSFLTEDRGQSVLLAGWLVSGYWAGLTVGRLALGGVSRRLGDMLTIQLCLLGTIAGLLLLWLAPGTAAAVIGLALAGFCLGPLFPTAIATISRFVPARLLPTAVGFLVSMAAAGGAFFPWLAGVLANRFGVWVILPYALGLTGIMLGVWLAFGRSAARAAVQAAEARAVHLPAPQGVEP